MSVSICQYFSAACAEVVRATQIDLVATADLVCYGHEATQVLGCVAEYGPGGDGARVLIRNAGTYSEIQRTTVHELVHIAMRCSRGTFDVGHTNDVWHGLR